MTLKNRFTLIGRVGSDPELSTGEKEFARFSIATDASYKKDGEKVERTDWHRLAPTPLMRTSRKRTGASQVLRPLHPPPSR